MSVYETQHARGDCVAPPRHELGYAALVLQGAYDELSAEGVWRVEAGDLVLHPAFDLHLVQHARATKLKPRRVRAVVGAETVNRWNPTP